MALWTPSTSNASTDELNSFRACTAMPMYLFRYSVRWIHTKTHVAGIIDPVAASDSSSSSNDTAPQAGALMVESGLYPSLVMAVKIPAGPMNRNARVMPPASSSLRIVLWAILLENSASLKVSAEPFC